MSVVLRRPAATAYGILNCDIDELATTRSGTSLFDLAKHSRHGLVSFRGRWIEPIAQSSGPRPRTHRDFLLRYTDSRSFCRPTKWALDPSRSWVAKLDVHPYWHWLENRPMLSKSMPADAFYRHFKGINTGWKEDRSGIALDQAGLVQDDDLACDFARM